MMIRAVPPEHLAAGDTVTDVVRGGPLVGMTSEALGRLLTLPNAPKSVLTIEGVEQFRIGDLLAFVSRWRNERQTNGPTMIYT